MIGDELRNRYVDEMVAKSASNEFLKELYDITQIYI